MALKIKWTYNGKIIDAYVKILAVNSRRQQEGINEFGVGGVSNVISSDGTLKGKDFHFDVIYGIYDSLTGTVPICKGNLVAPYNLTSNLNIYQYTYGELKKQVKYFKNAIDI